MILVEKKGGSKDQVEHVQQNGKTKLLLHTPS